MNKIIRDIAGSYSTLFILALLGLPLFFLNIHEGHSIGGDDYAQYIKEAQNIAAGRHFYTSHYVFNPFNNCYAPPQYPPGFPLLLAPVIKIWGLAIRPMCYFNSVIALLLLFCFHAYFRKYTGRVAAIAIAVLVTYSGILIDMKEAVLSDGTSLLFVMLYLLLRRAGSWRWPRMLLLVLCAAMAILIRTQSILLLFAEIIFLLMALLGLSRDGWPVRKALSSLLPVIGGTVVAVVFFNKVVFYCPSSAAGFYVDFLKATYTKGLLTVVRDNCNFFLQAIQSFFHYNTDNSIRTAMVTVIEDTGLILCMLGFAISVARKPAFHDVFFMLVCGMVLYYPIHDTRYFLPVIAIVYYYCLLALRRIIPSLTGVKPLYIGLGMAVIVIFAGARHLRATLMPPVGYIPGDNDRQAFHYIDTHISDDDIIVCARPRMITLYTNKKCMIHAWQLPMQRNKEIFDSMKVKYLLVQSFIAEDYYREYLTGYEHPLDSLKIADKYMLYRLR